MFIVEDETLCLFTRQSADSWRGMEGGQQVAKSLVPLLIQAEEKVAAQVNKVGGTHRSRSLFLVVYAQPLKCLRNEGGHITLLPDVFLCPRATLSLTRQLVGRELHGSSQGDASPSTVFLLQQHLWSSNKPSAGLRRADKGNEETGIELTGILEKQDRVSISMSRCCNATGQHQLLKLPGQQCLVETSEVGSIVFIYIG